MTGITIPAAETSQVLVLWWSSNDESLPVRLRAIDFISPTNGNFLPDCRYTPRSTLNSRNSRAGNGVSNFQTMLIGRSPSADSSVTGPQAR